MVIFKMTEPIRILHMIGSLNIGGSQSMIINLHKAIDKTKIQFDYIIDHPSHLYYEPVIRELGGRIFVLPSFNGLNFITIRKAWQTFFDEHKEYRILHSHIRSYASIYLPVAHKAGVKTIIHSHSTSNGSGLSAIVKRALQFPLRYQADSFFACSKEAGAWLFGKKIVNGKNFHILQNAIDCNKYRFNQNTRDEYRKAMNLTDKKVFIHVGRFHPAKNHLFLLNLFAEIYKKDKKAVLLLVGDGELRSVIEKKIEELNIQKSVFVLGNRSDVPDLLQSADCFLFPSIWEGLGMVAIEAQAVGLPCICSTGVPQMVSVVPDLCYFLPTDDMQKWVDLASKLHPSYFETSNYLRKSGYDIKVTAKEMMLFYMKNWEVK